MRQDEARIQQILNNLLSNAIKFTPEGGRIQVVVNRITRPPVVKSLTTPDSEEIPFLEMIVKDSGVGVAEEDRQIIFEKFRQGKSSSNGGAMTREYSGSGLGLSIVNRIMVLHRGSVTVKSVKGEYTEFIVSMPLTQS